MKPIDNVRDWLEANGFGRFVELFEENEIDGEVLKQLTNDDLKELGLPLGARKKLLAAITNLGVEEKQNASETVESTATTDAERRQLTVMFCDLVGSTALSAQYDPEDLSDIVRAYQDACASIISRYDGHIARYMGDGMLVYFGYPQAHEDDAERALRTGLEIIERVGQLTPRDNLTLQTRVGVATGLVVVGETVGEASAREQVVMGETPNLAARLQGLAEPDQIVIAESTHRLCGDVFDYDDLGEQRLKGFDDSILAYAVVGERSMESRFAARSGQHLLPIIGREQEIGLLTERWRLAKAGEGQLVLLTGEAGIGKSRITRAMIDAVAEENHYRINYQCSPYHSDSALYPAIRQLTLASNITSADDLETRFDKLDAVLRQAGNINAEQSALMADLIGLDGEGRYGALDLTPQRKRAHTLQALVDQLIGLAKQKPVLFVLEDAHWIDPTTQELIDLLLDAITDARALILVTARPTFDHGFGGHPIVTRLMLNRLGREHISSIVSRLTNNKALPDELLDEITAKTDGVPLFVEELTKTILESGLLKETDTTFELEGPLSSLSIPISLHDSLMARLDRLQPVKEVAQTAACIGREFDHDLLSSVSPLSDNELQVALQKLIAAELVYRRGLAPAATYQFKHALVRDAAYESLLRSRRQIVHKRIAAALREKFPEVVTAQPELLAHHYTEAGLVSEAIEFLLRAGRRATERSANPEAVAHLTGGLSLVETLADSPQRARQELALQIALVTPLTAITGYASTETVNTYARARELCETLGEFEEYLPVLFGQYVNHLVGGDKRRAHNAATELLALAEERKDDAIIMRAHVSLGWTRLVLGEHSAGALHNDQALQMYDHERHSELRFRYVLDPYVSLLVCRVWLTWLRGFPKQATRVATEAIAYVREQNHVSGLGYALTWAGAQFAANVHRDAAAVEGFTDELIRLSEQQGLTLWLDYARMISGWSLAKRGRREEGLTLLRDGIAKYRAQGRGFFVPMLRALLAELDIDGGEPRRAQQTLDEATAYIERSDERMWEAEIHRLKGEASIGASAENAAACFGRALEVARQQDAKMLELRAATSLARLRQGQGKSTEARDVLTPVYDWFTEGFETADLKEAKALLQELQ